MKKMMFNDRYGLTEAALQGKKSVTRRILNIQPNKIVGGVRFTKSAKPQSPVFVKYDFDNGGWIDSPYAIGEIVAVAQSYENAGCREDKIFYRSVPEVEGYKKELAISQKGWNNKMFVFSDLMPHQIRILDVRAERLQDITEVDCLREGVCKATMGYYIKGLIANWEKESHTEHEDGRCYKLFPTPKEAFASLIDKISGKGTWDHNPYVWRIEFELVETNEK